MPVETKLWLSYRVDATPVRPSRDSHSGAPADLRHAAGTATSAAGNTAVATTESHAANAAHASGTGQVSPQTAMLMKATAPPLPKRQ